jgi:hypothetical protein
VSARADILAGIRPKPIHMLKLVSHDGDVSPLCAKTPRKIDLRLATWTIRKEAVTCAKCRRALAEAAGLDTAASPGQAERLL